MSGIGGGGGLDKIMHMLQQLLHQVQHQQQGGEASQAGGCDQGGQNDPAQMFQQVLQHLLQEVTQGQGCQGQGG